MSDDFVGMAGATVDTLSFNQVGQPWIGVDQGGFHFLCGVWIHTMPVDDVLYLEAGDADFVDAFVVVGGCAFVDLAEFAVGVVEYPIVGSFADIKGFAVTWIYQAINVVLDLVAYFGRKAVSCHRPLPCWGSGV